MSNEAYTVRPANEYIVPGAVVMPLSLDTMAAALPGLLAYSRVTISRYQTSATPPESIYLGSDELTAGQQLVQTRRAAMQDAIFGLRATKDGAEATMRYGDVPEALVAPYLAHGRLLSYAQAARRATRRPAYMVQDAALYRSSIVADAAPVLTLDFTIPTILEMVEASTFSAFGAGVQALIHLAWSDWAQIPWAALAKTQEGGTDGALLMPFGNEHHPLNPDAERVIELMGYWFRQQALHFALHLVERHIPDDGATVWSDMSERLSSYSAARRFTRPILPILASLVETIGSSGITHAAGVTRVRWMEESIFPTYQEHGHDAAAILPLLDAHRKLVQRIGSVRFDTFAQTVFSLMETSYGCRVPELKSDLPAPWVSTSLPVIANFSSLSENVSSLAAVMHIAAKPKVYAHEVMEPLSGTRFLTNLPLRRTVIMRADAVGVEAAYGVRPTAMPPRPSALAARIRHPLWLRGEHHRGEVITYQMLAFSGDFRFEGLRLNAVDMWSDPANWGQLEPEARRFLERVREAFVAHGSPIPYMTRGASTSGVEFSSLTPINDTSRCYRDVGYDQAHRPAPFLRMEEFSWGYPDTAPPSGVIAPTPDVSAMATVAPDSNTSIAIVSNTTLPLLIGDMEADGASTWHETERAPIPALPFWYQSEEHPFHMAQEPTQGLTPAYLQHTYNIRGPEASPITLRAVLSWLHPTAPQEGRAEETSVEGGARVAASSSD